MNTWKITSTARKFPPYIISSLAKWFSKVNQFAQSDFATAGFPDWVRNRIEQIAGHEAQYVALLSGALGSAATQPCNYSFPVTDVTTFLGLATIVESVGVSAYLGAPASIMEKEYVTVAGSILTTEARHQAWINSAVLKNAAWSGPEDTPLDFNEVYSIASAFITGCPSSNPTLPVKAFPALTIGTDGTVTTSADTSNAYVQVIAGLTTDTFRVVNGRVQGMPQPQGISYAVLTSQQNTTLISDDNILAGPAIMNNPFVSQDTNPAPSF